MSDFKTALIIPDMHVPFHDRLAYELMLKVAVSTKIDKIVQLGDFIDAYPISKYVKEPHRSSGFDLQNEIDCAHDIIKELSDIAELTILEGNHEIRLEKYLKERAPGLYGLDAIKIKKLLTTIKDKKTDKPAILKNPVFYEKSIFLGKLFVFHGDLWTKSGSQHSSQTAMRNVDRSGLNIMHGHIHRLGSYYVTKRGYELKGFEMGCMCNTEVEYVHHPNWQIAFGFVHYRDAGDKAFYVEQVEIEKCGKNNSARKAFYRGKVYEVE